MVYHKFIKCISLCIVSLCIKFSAIAQNWIIFNAYPRGEKISSIVIKDGRRELIHDTSKYGHAWVSFIKRDEIAKQTILDEKWGFHSLQASFYAYFLSEEAKLDSDIFSRPANSVVVEVDNSTYEECKKVKQIWEKKNYSVLAKQTCVQFTRDVAEKIENLDMPDEHFWTYKFPSDFIAELKDRNAKIDSLSRITLNNVQNNQQDFEENSTPVASKSDVNKPLLGKTVFSGAKTADELGRKLLLAIKTNNKTLWYNCIQTQSKELTDKYFEEVKDCLQQHGVSNFSQLAFSRVKYVDFSRTGSGGKYGMYKIEFNYGQDFWGAIGGLNFALVYKDQFMLDHSFRDCIIQRKR